MKGNSYRLVKNKDGNVYILVAAMTLATAHASPESMAVKLDPKVCAKIGHGRYVTLPIDPKDPKAGTFKQFFTTQKPFNPRWPSVIEDPGGPGSVSAQIDPTLGNSLPKTNVLMYHPRGAGCNVYPLDQAYDRYLTSDNIAADIDGIRAHLKIDKWAAVIGISYGTAVARVYAHHYPTRVRKLVIDSIYNPDEAAESTGLPEYFEVLRRLSQKVQPRFAAVIGHEAFENIKRQIEADVLTMTSYKAEGSPIEWVNDLLKGNPVAPVRSKYYGIALVYLAFAGEMDQEGSDEVGSFLFGEFDSRLLPKADKKNLFQRLERTLFTFAFADYADLAKGVNFLSHRINVNLKKNDKNNLKFCSAVPVVALHGELDIATLASDAIAELSKKDCYRGGVTLALFAGAGPNVTSGDCGQAMVHAAVTGRNLNGLNACNGVKVDIK